MGGIALVEDGTYKHVLIGRIVSFSRPCADKLDSRPGEVPLKRSHKGVPRLVEDEVELDDVVEDVVELDVVVEDEVVDVDDDVLDVDDEVEVEDEVVEVEDDVVVDDEVVDELDEVVVKLKLLFNSIAKSNSAIS